MTREFAPDERFEPDGVGLDVETHRPVARSEATRSKRLSSQAGT